jgi:hypothetical protein
MYNLIPLAGEVDLFLLGDLEFLGERDGDLEPFGDFEFRGDLDRFGDFEPCGDFELLLVLLIGDLDSRFGDSLSTEDPLRTGESESERTVDESFLDSGLSMTEL